MVSSSLLLWSHPSYHPCHPSYNTPPTTAWQAAQDPGLGFVCTCYSPRDGEQGLGPHAQPLGLPLQPSPGSGFTAHPPPAHIHAAPVRNWQPVLAPQPLNPLLCPCFPSSRKCALIRGADGFTPPGTAQAYGGSSPGRDWQRKHSPSTAASCSTWCCSRACSAGLCMNSSAPPRLEPSRFTNCRADSRGSLRARGSPGAWAVSWRPYRPAVAWGAHHGCS